MIGSRATMLAGIATLVAFAARADIKIGVTLAQTGPAASLGIPQKNTVALLPAEIGGQHVEWIVLDDATDSSRAVANARKLIDEDNVDALVGSSTTPSSIAMTDVAAEKKVPMISLAASAKIIEPPTGPRAWVFKMPQNDALMADAIADHMAAHGVKSVAFIGFNDAYGDGWLTEATRALKAKGIELLDSERFARADTSVTGQVLKMMASQPGAILIAGAGTPAALPEKTLKERGFAGPIYQTHGVVNPDFLRVGGKDLEGTVLPAGPIVVASQLPDGNPVKMVAQRYIAAYDAKYGPGTASAFGAHLYDAGLLLSAAIPVALTHAQPGTPAFRAALRDALEGAHDVVLDHGVMSLSPTDHNGLDKRARVMVAIEGGTWHLLP